MEVQVYSTGSDDFVPVTQEWCDNSQQALNLLGLQREIIRLVANLRPRGSAEDKDATRLKRLSAFMQIELDLMTDQVRAVVKAAKSGVNPC